MATNGHKRQKSGDLSLSDLAEAEIRAQLEAITTQRESSCWDKDLALSTAALMRALTAADGERRQREKAEMRSLRSFPTDQIVAYLKSLPDRQRIAIGRELAGADDEEPLL